MKGSSADTAREHVATASEGALLRVTLNRPEKANALTSRMLVRLEEVFREAAGDPGLRVMTLESASERVFCAGADLSELSRDPEDPSRDLWDKMSAALAQVPILTLALINGPCVGGALTLALGCDLRLAAPEAFFGYPVLRNGVLPPRRDAQRLSALVGPGRSAMILLGGARVAAPDAERWGLVDRVVPRDALAAEAQALYEAALSADREHLVALKERCRDSRS